MSCAHPFLMKSDRYSPYTSSYMNYIPCGWCLNCRVDKQNELTHRCEYEFTKFKSGAFVTLTYDDPHIEKNIVKDSTGKLVATLNRSDLKHYMYRLRKNIQRHLPNCLLSDHHFKFLAVGEYGQDGQIFDRPHFHILFFGLDFAYCKKEIEKSWQGNGMIKCLPILNGGIRYVLKYLDKQLFGKQAQQQYEDNNIERPFQVHSLGLGQNLFKSQISYMKTHNGCYRWKGHNVPCPAYYKNKLLIQTNKYINYTKQKREYKNFNGFYPKSSYDLHEFSIRNSLIREENMTVKNHLYGRPDYHFYDVQKLKSFSKEYLDSLLNQII